MLFNGKTFAADGLCMRLIWLVALVPLAGCVNQLVQDSLLQSIRTSQVCDALDQPISAFQDQIRRVLDESHQCLAFADQDAEALVDAAMSLTKERRDYLISVTSEFRKSQQKVHSTINKLADDVRATCAARQDCAREILQQLTANRHLLVDLQRTIQDLVLKLDSVTKAATPDNQSGARALDDLHTGATEFLLNVRAAFKDNIETFQRYIVIPYVSKRLGEQALRHLEQFVQPIEASLDRLDQRLYGAVSLANLTGSVQIREELSRIYADSSKKALTRVEDISGTKISHPNLREQVRVGLARGACSQVAAPATENASKVLMPLVRSVLILGLEDQVRECRSNVSPAAASGEYSASESCSDFKLPGELCPRLRSRNLERVIKSTAEQQLAAVRQQQDKATIQIFHAFCAAINEAATMRGRVNGVQCHKSATTAELTVVVSRAFAPGAARDDAIREALSEIAEMALNSRMRIAAKIVVAAAGDENVTLASVSSVKALQLNVRACSAGTEQTDVCRFFGTHYRYSLPEAKTACTVNCEFSGPPSAWVGSKTRAAATIAELAGGAPVGGGPPPMSAAAPDLDATPAEEISVYGFDDADAMRKHTLKLLSFVRAAWAAAILHERSEGTVVTSELEPRGELISTDGPSERDRRIRIFLRPQI